jgi:hypothetical protein
MVHTIHAEGAPLEIAHLPLSKAWSTLGWQRSTKSTIFDSPFWKMQILSEDKIQLTIEQVELKKTTYIFNEGLFLSFLSKFMSMSQAENIKWKVYKGERDYTYNADDYELLSPRRDETSVSKTKSLSTKRSNALLHLQSQKQSKMLLD